MRRILVATALSAALACAACGPVNRGLESVNQPVVTRTNYAFDVSAAALRSGSDAEAHRLDAWFDALGLGYGDRVAIDDPAGNASWTTREAVSRILAHHGLLLEEQAPVTTGEIPAGSVRVVVTRASAEVPNCPNWSRPSQPEFAGSTGSNYGCAINANLAAMVANPEDLVRGQTATGNSDARSITKAVQAYRDAKPTGAADLKKESTQSGVQ
jgi:pilus assembly protein CpaD